MIAQASKTGQRRAAPRTYAEECGWKITAKTPREVSYSGFYRARGLRFQGFVQECGDQRAFFIRQPPIDLIRDTEYAGCFHSRGDGWWLITFKPGSVPKDIDGGIASIELTLVEAFTKRSSRRRMPV